MKYMLLMYAKESEAPQTPEEHIRLLHKPGQLWGRKSLLPGCFSPTPGLARLPMRPPCVFETARH